MGRGRRKVARWTSGANRVSRVRDSRWPLPLLSADFVGRIDVKRPDKGSKRRFLAEYATWLMTAQLLLETRFMTRVAFQESQARNRRKLRIHINLRRKSSSPSFSKKPENVAFRSMLTARRVGSASFGEGLPTPPFGRPWVSR